MQEKQAFQDKEMAYLRHLVVVAPLPSTSASTSHEPASKVRVLESSGYGGSHDAMEVKNFLWDMKSYFKAASVADHDQVDMATMFLIVDTKLW